MNQEAPSKVQQLYHRILEAEAQGALAAEAPPLSASVQTLVEEVAGDDVLAEAAVAWVRMKKREMMIATLVALRGREWVDNELQRMEEASA